MLFFKIPLSKKLIAYISLISFILLITQSSFPQGINIEKKRVDDLFREGMELYQQGEYSKAIEKFSPITYISEDKKTLADTYFYLSLCYYAIGDTESAKEKIKKVIELDPMREISSLFYPDGYVDLFNQIRGEVEKLRSEEKKEEEIELKKLDKEKKLEQPIKIKEKVPIERIEKEKKRGFHLEVIGSYFKPSEKAFQDIYGSGMSYGIEVGQKIWKWIEVWAEWSYFKKIGHLTFTKEDTDIQIIPLCAGIKLRLAETKIIPYIGVGFGYFQYQEKNPIIDVKKGDIGYIGQIGCLFNITVALFFDFQASYNYCKVKPVDIKADLGGLHVRLGLGLEF